LVDLARRARWEGGRFLDEGGERAVDWGAVLWEEAGGAGPRLHRSSS